MSATATQLLPSLLDEIAAEVFLDVNSDATETSIVKASHSTFKGVGRIISEQEYKSRFTFLTAISKGFLEGGDWILFGTHRGIIHDYNDHPYILTENGERLRTFAAFIASTDELLEPKQVYPLVSKLGFMVGEDEKHSSYRVIQKQFHTSSKAHLEVEMVQNPRNLVSLRQAFIATSDEMQLKKLCEEEANSKIKIKSNTNQETTFQISRNLSAKILESQWNAQRNMESLCAIGVRIIHDQELHVFRDSKTGRVYESDWSGNGIREASTNMYTYFNGKISEDSQILGYLRECR